MPDIDDPRYAAVEIGRHTIRTKEPLDVVAERLRDSTGVWVCGGDRDQYQSFSLTRTFDVETDDGTVTVNAMQVLCVRPYRPERF